MRFIIYLVLVTLVFTQKNSNELSFLEGTWKIDGKEKYEEWKRTANGNLTANIFKIQNTDIKITETSKIILRNSEIFYDATVPSQNNGRTISFQLVSSKNFEFIFENKTHDFPNKIIYQKISPNKLLIKVLNNQNKGFTYYMNRQSPQSMNIRHIVLDMFKGFNDHDWEKHVSYNSPNIIIRNPDSKMKPKTPSKEEQIKSYADLASWCPDIQDKIVSLNIVENKAIVEFEAYGNTVEGKPFNLPIITVLEFEEEMVIKETTYYDNK